MTTPRRLIALLSALFLLPLLAVTTATSTASASAGDRPLFTPLGGFRPGPGADVRVRPHEFRAFRVDLAGVRAALAGGGTHRLAVPAPTGEVATFTVTEDSVMAPEMQADHPEIRTYAGRGPAGSSIRLDVTPMGFHAFVRNPDGRSWYVDPAENRRGEDRVLSYAGGAVPAADRSFVERELQRHAAVAGSGDFAPSAGGIVSMRTYRLAFLTDSTYADYFGSANVLAEKTTLVNRVNEVYNDDVAIRFEMVTGTDTKLNLDTPAKETGPNGPCGANPCFTPDELEFCDSPTLDRNEFVLGQIIGAENFDVGHIGLGKDGGGIAGLGVVGGPFKADGCTGLPDPTGDFYAIDYVAHELGHQMGGDHTFNGNQNPNSNCGPFNRAADPYTVQVEPGSGSSIMAYAGICGSDNLQPHSDPYFSFASVDQINATTSATNPPTDDVQEQQVVNFTGLNAGEEMTISCATGCTPTNVTYTGTAVDIAAFSSAVTSATGSPAVVSGYDGDTAPGADGFTADWTASTDMPTLTVTPAGGATFTTFTGTIYNGGPWTNQGVVTATSNKLAGRRRSRRQDGPDPDAVHPDRHGNRRQRRRAHLHVGADRCRRAQRHPLGAHAGQRHRREPQDRRAAVPAVRGRGRRQRRRLTALQLAGGEPGRHLAQPDLPRPRADPGRQHQRGHGHLPRGGRRAARPAGGHRLLLGVPADERLGRQPVQPEGHALPADRARRVHP